MDNRLRITLLTVGMTVAAQQAYAQVLPGSARPDAIERQYRIENQRPDLGGAPIIQTQEPQAKEIRGGVAFELNGITIENGTVYKESELKHLYKDKIGTKVTIGELNAIASAITTYYRNNGYILTRAIVPPQRAEDGNVKIRIVEGFVDQVRIEGDAADSKPIQAYADKIRANKPLNAATLERYLLLMDDLPGVEARAVLQPSATTPGASDVVVNVTRKRVEGSVNFDNRGSRFLGAYQLGGTLAANNIFTDEDQTQLRVINTPFESEELFYSELRHEMQLGGEGTKLMFSGNHIRTEPGASVAPLEFQGESNSFTIGANHPLLRSRQSNWFVNTDFTVRNVDVNALGADFYYDKTRVLSVGTAYDFVDSLNAINRLDASVGKGFALGTDTEQNKSRANGQESFFKMNARASRIQPISGPWSAYAAASGQYSFDPLLASEEFAIGGTEFGSAYDPAEITGDSGLAGRLELQYNQAPQGFIDQYQLYTFYDLGRVWNQDPIPGSESEHVSLSSAGIGARFNIAEAVSGSVEGAVPLTKHVSAMGTDGNSPRAFFALQYRF